MNAATRTLINILASATLALGSGGCSTLEQAQAFPTPSVAAAKLSGPFPVTRVVDGDTIWLDRGGTRAKVRLIGIDTPETVDPRKGLQCFGIAASKHAKELLTGQSVFLETDPSQSSTDKYGRALAYVWLVDGRLMNLDLIADGFAHEYTYDVPYRYRDQFRAAETDARMHQRGLWSPTTCDGNTGQSGR